MPIPLFKRLLYAFAAFIALLIGALGLIIPIIPGVLFVILAVVLLARASRRFHARLLASPRTGPYLQRWEGSQALAFCARMKLAGLLLYAAAADSLRRKR